MCISYLTLNLLKLSENLENGSFHFLTQIAGPFRRLSTRVQQNAWVNTFDMQWCPMCIFLFLRFYNFIKGIMPIYKVFLKKIS